MAEDKKNSNILDIVQGIQQAAANGYDGALDKEGKPVKTGLKRDEGNPILDGRVLDGFAVNMQGDKLLVTYHSEIRLEDVHDKTFEKDVTGMINDVVKFLKKEYKNVTGKALTLTRDEDYPVKVRVESTSRVRAWVLASAVYTIGGAKQPRNKDAALEGYEKSWNKWLKSQEKKGKKPKNVEIGEKENEKKDED